MTRRQVRQIERITSDESRTVADRRSAATAIALALTNLDEQAMAEFYLASVELDAVYTEDELAAARD